MGLDMRKEPVGLKGSRKTGLIPPRSRSGVMAEAGFQLEKGLSRPTHRQKALYVLRKRRLSREAIQVPELAVSAIEELSASITRSAYTRGAMSAYGRLSATEIQ